MHSKLFKLIFVPALLVLMAGCGKVNDISIKSIGDVKLKGINKNVVQLSLEVEVDNPNNRRITITHIEFKAWFRERELGNFRTTETIKLTPCSKSKYIVPVELEFRTMADAFKLVTGSIDDLLDNVEVEGYIKGKSFPVRKKLLVARQPFRKLSSSL